MGINEFFNAAKEKIGGAFRWRENKDTGKKSQEQIPTAKIETTEETREEFFINLGAETEKSIEHPKNEDNFYINMNERTAAVFDGMGGHAGGEIASGIAAESMPEFDQAVNQRIADAEKEGKRLSSEEEARIIEEELKRFLEETSAEIYQVGKNRPEFRGLGSTASIMRFTRDGKKLIIGQIGDSRVYRLRKGKLERISPEDSLVEVAIKYGLLDSDQNVKARVNIKDIEKKIGEISKRKDLDEQEKQTARGELMSLLTHLGRIRASERQRTGQDNEEIPLKWFRNVIYGTPPLGSKRVEPHLITYDVQKGDRYLVSSDGVHDNATDKEIAKILSGGGTPEERAKKLVIKSNEISKNPTNPRAKEDDITAIVVDVDDKAKATKLEERARREKTRKNLETDLEKFRTTISALGIKEIRNILEILTRERNTMETRLQSDPNNEELALQLEFTRRKEELAARQLTKEYESGQKERIPTRPITPKELERILGK